MTLKEKFDSISCKDCDMPYCDIKCTMLSDWELNKLEQIADDYAIEFAKWLRYNCVETDYGWQNHGKQYSDEEILKLFKKEKGYDTTALS